MVTFTIRRSLQARWTNRIAISFTVSRVISSENRYPLFQTVRLLHGKQFDVEDQRSVRRDHAAGTARAITQRRRDDQRALAADFHGGDALVPSGDHAMLADRKLERLVAVDGGVELFALLPVLIEPTGIMHHADLARPGRGAGADLGIDDLQS